MNIILASKSPRRKELLEKFNLKFKVIESLFDESTVETKNVDPQDYCLRLAKGKCEEVANKYKSSLVIGADTIVYYNDMILNKPANKKEAIEHLNILSANTHQVYTGVFLMVKEKDISLSFYEKTDVTFNHLDNNDIEYYTTHCNPYDKAGSYGIQDWSIIFVEKINGCFNNVVGFPVSKFYKLAMNHKIINQIIKNNSNQ